MKRYVVTNKVLTGSRIKKLREEAKITCLELAIEFEKKHGTPIYGCTIWKWEKGQLAPTTMQLATIAKKFNADIGWLLGWERSSRSDLNEN